MLGVDKCGSWQRTAFISNSTCHREATATGTVPQTLPLGPPGILTGQPCLGATWGGGESGRRHQPLDEANVLQPARSTAAMFVQATQVTAWCLVPARAAWLCRADQRPRSGQDVCPSRLPPELRPVPPLGSDFPNGPFLSRNNRRPCSGSRVAPLPRGSCPVMRARSLLPLGLFRLFVWVGDGQWFKKHGRRDNADAAARGGRSASRGRAETHVETRGPPVNTW